ncbi:MAG: glycosyltransferase family 4 protein [Allosphingosinicella sp.]
MRILALTKYAGLAASTRQRFVQYIPYLREHGIEVEILPLLPNSHLEALNLGRRRGLGAPIAYMKRLAALLTRRDYDLLWVHFELFPYMPGWTERLAGWRGKPVVYDYDDANFHVYDSNRNAMVRRFLGGKLGPVLSRAAAVVCGNRYIEAYAERFCPNTIIIPTVVDTDVYLPAGPGSAQPAAPLVGWVGSPTTWLNVEPLIPTIVDTLSPFGGRFRAVGPGSAATALPGIELVEWSEASEVGELQRLDIGIMPLLDRPFQKGKCGYKLIQYMACGVPVIASPVGVNSEIVTHGENGFLASTEEEWAEALRRLLSDAGLRRRMGEAGRRRVEQRYSLRVQQPRLLELFKSLVPESDGLSAAR